VSADARRTYRVDRVRRVEVLDETFDPPAGDPVQSLEDHLAVGWEYEVDVVLDAPLDVVSRYMPRSLGSLEPVDEVSCRLRATTSSPAWYAQQLAGFPVACRIAGGPELRDAAREVGRRLLAAAE
jgi:predicted DNA-binding transcriptional regulator YafY